jgi:hypothetical protein
MARRFLLRIAVALLGPWTFVIDTFHGESGLLSEQPRSMRAVGIIVGNYNSGHLRDHRMIWWHLSEMSLTIWVTRHWTTDQIVTAAASLARSRPNPTFRN